MTDYSSAFGPITLAGLIAGLEGCDPEREVMLDYCGLGPTNFASYRGYYDHLALGYQEGHRIRAGELLELARAEVGSQHFGYKGGEYRMTLETPVWIANHGDCWGQGIESVDSGGEDGWRVVLRTRNFDA